MCSNYHVGVKSLLLLSLLCFTLANAEVTIRQVSGASRIIGINPPTEAWGVFVGTYRISETSPYNNCPFSLLDDAANGTTGTPDPNNPSVATFHGCHEGRVNGDSVISIQFTESEEISNLRAYAVISPPSGSTSAAIKKVGESLNTVSGPNQTATVTFTWRELCQQIKTDPSISTAFIEATQTCQANGSLTVAVGFGTSYTDLISTKSVTFNLYSPNPALGIIVKPTVCGNPVGDEFGFCDLAVFPGDQSGYLYEGVDTTHQNKLHRTSFSINAFDAYGNSLTLTNKVEGMRIFISPTSFIDAQPNVPSTSIHDFTISSVSLNTASFENNKFGGLKNSTAQNPVSYYVRASTIDSSGTISQLMGDDYCPGGVCDDFKISPSQVAGIISENSCFITTATYGSNEAYQVKFFKAFRKKFLLTNSFGRKIILFYNTYGPMGAHWIQANPSAQKYIRVILYPFYAFAYLSLRFSIFLAVLIYLSLSLLLFILIKHKIFNKI